MHYTKLKCLLYLLRYRIQSGGVVFKALFSLLQVVCFEIYQSCGDTEWEGIPQFKQNEAAGERSGSGG